MGVAYDYQIWTKLGIQGTLGQVLERTRHRALLHLFPLGTVVDQTYLTAFIRDI